MSEIISRVNLGGNISPIATSNIFIASSTDGVNFTTRTEDSTITLFNGISINVLFQATPSTSETSYLAVITSSEPSAFPIRPAVGNDYATWCANAGAPLINNQQVVNLTFIDGAWIITSATPSRDTNTTYSSKTAASGGTATSLVTTGEKYTWNNKADGNHTHTTSIAVSSGTNQLTLEHGKKYALNAGGTSYIFTMPGDNNTNQTIKGNGTAFGASDAIDIVGSGATTVTADATNKKITISSTNTTYTDATTSKSGLMSSTDKKNLNTLVDLLKDDDSDTTINTIQEVLNAFANTPEGTDVANALAAKQDKITSSNKLAASNVSGLATVATSGKYSDLSGKPSSLKNPNSITIKAGTDTVSSYDGSAAKTFTIAASSTAGAFTISDGTTTKTVQLAGKFTDSNTTYSAAKYNTLGLLKPAYTSTGAATLTTAAASNTETPTIAAKTTTSGRYYAVEADKNGVAYVNVPWSNTNTTYTFSAGTTPPKSASFSGTKTNNLVTSTTTKYLSASASGTAVGANGTGSCAPSGHTHTITVSGTSGSNSGSAVTAVNATVANGVLTLTSVTAAPNSHTHSYGNSTALTSSGNSGTAVTALTGVKVTAQPTISLTANSSTATGRITYLESSTKGDYTPAGSVTLTAGTAPSLTAN